jgi:hypothetical protein
MVLYSSPCAHMCIRRLVSCLNPLPHTWHVRSLEQRLSLLPLAGVEDDDLRNKKRTQNRTQTRCFCVVNRSTFSMIVSAICRETNTGPYRPLRPSISAWISITKCHPTSLVHAARPGCQNRRKTPHANAAHVRQSRAPTAWTSTLFAKGINMLKN